MRCYVVCMSCSYRGIVELSYREIMELRSAVKCPQCEVKMMWLVSCKSCNQLIVSDREVLECPQCESYDIKLLSNPESPSWNGSMGEGSKMKMTFRSILARVDPSILARMVVGLIGFILTMVGVGLITDSFRTGITLLVVGFIFLAIATSCGICYCN